MNEETRNDIAHIAEWMDDRGEDADSLRTAVAHKIRRGNLLTKVRAEYSGRNGHGFCARVNVVYLVSEWCKIEFESWVDPEEGLTGRVTEDEPGLPRIKLDDYRQFPT